MNVCSRCGNRISTWAHGVCHVCGRIEKEQKRFGRRAIKRPYRRQLDSLSARATIRTRHKGGTSPKLSYAAPPKAGVRIELA